MCGLSHTTQHCFGHLNDASRAQFPDAVQLPCWGDLLRQNVAIFDLDFDAILAAMYALTDSAEGDCYLSVPPNPGNEAATLGATAFAALGTGESAAPGTGESALSGTAPTKALHTFTLDSGASRSFFRDSTTLMPLNRPVAVSLADPSRGPVLAHSSTVLLCPAAPSGLLSGLHLPSFSMSQVAASSQVFAAASRSSPASAPCSCRPLMHEALLWHHRLSHPSVPRLRGMASRTLGHECYFLLVVDDNSRYTSGFPLRSKGDVTEVLIDRIRGARRQLREIFGSDLPVLLLHSDRGGEFSSDLLRAFCRAEGIHQTFTLLASPQHNGIAERRIGMVMDVARTSMIHAAAPHFLWPFAVGDASAFRIDSDTSADKLSSRAVPYVFLGFPPDAPGWHFYHPTSRHVLSSQDVTFDESVSYYQLFPYRAASLPPPPLFLVPGTPPVDPLPPQGHAPSRVSQVDPAETIKVAVDSGAARGAEPAGAGTGGGEPERVEPGGGEPGGAVSWGAEPACAESGGTPGVPLRREPLSPKWLREWYARRCRRTTGVAGAGVAGGAAGAGATGGAAGTGAAGGAAGARAAGGAAGTGATGGAAGAGAAGGAAGASAAGGAAGAGSPEGAAGAGATGGTASAGAAGGAAGTGAIGANGPGGARPGGTGAAGAAGTTGIGAAGTEAGGAAGVVTGDPRAEGTGAISAISGGAAWPRPYYVPLLVQVLGLPPFPGPTPPSPHPVQSQSQLQPSSPLTSPSPYSGPTRGLTERREPESRPVSPVSRAVSPVRTPPPVPGTHSMTKRPSTAPQRVPLPSPPASSLPGGPDLESDSLRAASPTITRFLATAVTDPLFESSASSALVAELVDFAAVCRLDYATSLVAESASASATVHSSAYQSLDLNSTFGRVRRAEWPVHWDAAKRVLHYLCSTSGMRLVLGGRARVVLTGHADVSWVDDLATQRSSQGYTFSLGSGSVSWRSTRSSSVLSSSCEAEINAGAMSAQELRWLIYLLTDLGEAPRSPPVLYVDNKAMLALC
ncbi:unnamed protein product [Closterium sp. NIES-54]